MFATDFLFDNKRASDFGLMIASFDSEIPVAAGGEIEYTVVKTPGSNTFDFYGAGVNSVITWNFSIIKNTCPNHNYYFNQYEERQIAGWLLKQDGYKWFQFIQDGYEDIYYKTQINMSPHQLHGRTIGFDLTVTSDCGYGYSNELNKTYHLNKNNPIELEIHSDIVTYILPRLSLTGSGDFYISNNSDLSQNISNGKATSFKNVSEPIIINSDNDTITGIPSPNDFNWYFPRLVNGLNSITTDSEENIEITISYREPRRVII